MDALFESQEKRQTKTDRRTAELDCCVFKSISVPTLSIPRTDGPGLVRIAADERANVRCSSAYQVANTDLVRTKLVPDSKQGQLSFIYQADAQYLPCKLYY
mmetsp:Transcript_43569/g.170545  ORF Transcript_43569/g.170545 Transcript_43569/m.170545 type:complete len:101 (+) Transcript_43569:1859-2161(+)